MPRASVPDRGGHVADALRAIALQLQAFADDLLAADHETAGLSLGADDELTPAQVERLDAAVVRHRRRAKQARPEPQIRRREQGERKPPDRKGTP